jgi:excisionase family DNA binding protein
VKTLDQQPNDPGTPSADRHFCTAREFAERTGLSYTTVLRLIKRKKLRCLPYCRHKRIPPSELLRWEKGEF